jgi:hypothetical protein
MANEVDPKPTTNTSGTREMSELLNQVERLSAENLLLQQRLEFTALLEKHEKSHETQIADNKEKVQSEINRRLVAMTVVGLAALGIAWYQTITPIRKQVSARLDAEFASDNIRTLISQAAQKAAQDQAAKLMSETIKPATDVALDDIRKHRAEVSDLAQKVRQDSKNAFEQIHSEVSQKEAEQSAALQNLHTEYSKDVGQLKILLDYQERLKDIQLMKNEAILGDAASLDKLTKYSSQD